MIVTWNVRGMNRSGKLREINSRLLKLHPEIVIFLETRVKCVKDNKARDKVMLGGRFLNNYCNHSNGRIWMELDDKKVDIKHIRSTNQMIHYGVYDLNGNFKTCMTTIYAPN